MDEGTTKGEARDRTERRRGRTEVELVTGLSDLEVGLNVRD
jgi:hypothetical protein